MSGFAVGRVTSFFIGKKATFLILKDLFTKIDLFHYFNLYTYFPLSGVNSGSLVLFGVNYIDAESKKHKGS